MHMDKSDMHVISSRRFMITVVFTVMCATAVNACGSGSNNYDDDSNYSSGNRCSDLVLFPVGSVDPTDQYRFDYSDVGFGTTHQRGASVTVTCTSNGQSSSVYAFDNGRQAINSGSSIVARCAASGSSVGWTVSGRRLQYVDCRFS